MDTTKTPGLARSLMNAHGFGHVPFEWSRSKSRRGSILWNRVTQQPIKLTISFPLAQITPEEEIRNTILHEIAHLLAGYGHGHDAVWRKHAINLGHTGNRCYKSEFRAVAAWTSVCPNGHKGPEQHRAPLRVKSCTKCSPVFNPKFIYTWRQHGKRVSLFDMPVRYRREANSIMDRHAVEIG